MLRLSPRIVTGRSAELDQRKKFRDSRRIDLVAGLYTKEKLCRDKVAEIKALGRRVDADRQKVSQLRFEILLNDEALFREVKKRFRMVRRY